MNATSGHESPQPRPSRFLRALDGLDELREAIEAGDSERVRELVRRRYLFFRRVDPNDRRYPDDTPLTHAARRGHLEIVEILVGAGARVNGGSFGYHALHQAAAAGHLEVVRYLDSKGARHNIDRDGCDPLKYARAGGHDEVVAYFEPKRSSSVSS